MKARFRIQMLGIKGNITSKNKLLYLPYGNQN
jgi:hypothetical protein